MGIGFRNDLEGPRPRWRCSCALLESLWPGRPNSAWEGSTTSSVCLELEMFLLGLAIDGHWGRGPNVPSGLESMEQEQEREEKVEQREEKESYYRYPLKSNTIVNTIRILLNRDILLMSPKDISKDIP